MNFWLLFFSSLIEAAQASNSQSNVSSVFFILYCTVSFITEKHPFIMSSKDYIKKTTVSELFHTQMHLCLALSVTGLPRWWWGKESAYQCRRYETQVWSLGQEDPLEEEMTTHSSILAWRIPWTEEPCWLQFVGSQRIGHEWRDFACMHVTDNLDSSSSII